MQIWCVKLLPTPGNKLISYYCALELHPVLLGHNRGSFFEWLTLVYFRMIKLVRGSLNVISVSLHANGNCRFRMPGEYAPEMRPISPNRFILPHR